MSSPSRTKAPAPPPPTPAEIKAARQAAGLSQPAAAALIYCSFRTWQDWEAGIAQPHPAFWELWCLKAALEGKNGDGA